MNVRSALLATATAGAMIFSAGAVNAATVDTHLVNGLNQWIDDDAELMINRDANIFLGVGDSLAGVFTITKLRNFKGGGVNDTLIGDVTSNNELTGVFQNMVTAMTVTSDPNGSCGVDPTCGGGALLSGDELVTYTFGADPAFDTGGTGAMVRFYEDGANNFTIDGSDFSTATDGVLRLEAGITGLDADEQWTASNASSNPNAGFTANFGTIFASFNVDLSIISETFLLDFLQVDATDPSLLPGGVPLGDGKIDMHFTGTVEAFNQFGNGFPLSSQTTFDVNLIPEPGTLGLLGFGLVGLGAIYRRRRSA